MTSDELKTVATIIRHRDLLRSELQKIEQELARRGVLHDASKFSMEEIEGFVRINANARENPYNSPEYLEGMEREKGEGGCISHHYEHNSHHPECHRKIEDMKWLDIIEMVCDWKAASETYGKTSFRKGLLYQQQRFNVTWEQKWLIDQIADWLEDG